MTILADQAPRPSAAFARSARRYLQPSATSAAHITAQHPQLRDLIVSPEESDVAHLSGRAIDIVSFSGSQTGKRLPASQSRLPFKANCLATGQGLLCAGGQNSELSLRSLDEGYAYEDWSTANFSVGGSINNSIYVAPPVVTGSRARLYCSNNDQSVTLWDVIGPSDDVGAKANLLRADILPLNTAVNASAVSPDGRMAVAVGDSPEVFLYEVSHSGKHRPIKTIKGSRDSGFSVAWSRSSTSFAVAAQDGVVTVFDVRQCLGNRSGPALRDAGKLAVILTSNPGPYASAARVVKYSPGTSSELLAFTEQCGLAHVLDAKTYDEDHAQHIFLSAGPSSSAVPTFPARPARPHRQSGIALPRDLAHISSLPPNAGRAIRLAALTPPLPPSEAGPSRRHARRLVAHASGSRPSSGIESPVAPSHPLEVTAMTASDWSRSKLDTDGGSSPELTGLTWSADGERLYLGTESAIAEFSRDYMASAARPSSSIL